MLYPDLHDRLYDVPGTWGIRRCSNEACGLSWLDPMPLEQELPKLYRRYFTHSGRWEDGVSPLRSALKRGYGLALKVSLVGKQRQRHQQMYLSRSHAGKLLEVGCGGGATLLRFRQLGWDAEGQEVDADAAAAARRLSAAPVHLGPLVQLRLPEGGYDVIAMNHVVEHVAEPIGLLRECHRLLKPGGTLVAITPNAGSRIHRLFGASWFGLEPPRHFYLFNPGTLKETARRAGFSELTTWTTSVNALNAILGSIDIQQTGRHDMKATPRLAVMARALITQLSEGRAITGLNSDDGAECVLTARR